MRYLSLLALYAAAGLGAASTANAQQVPGEEEIVVTAQRREQSVQDVPLSVGVVSAETLQESGIRDIVQLQTAVPSLAVQVNNPPSLSTSFRMRGIGTAGQNTGLEGAVGFFIDGIYRARSGTALGDIIDVERVEVLRGPQGTLFGKSTTAGAISIITQAPDTHEFGGQADLTIGNLDARAVRASVNIPLAEDVAAVRLSGGYNTREGLLTDVSSGRELNDRDRYNFRGQFLWMPSEAVSWRIVGDFAEADEVCCQAVPRFPTALIADPIGDRVTNINDDVPVESSFQDRGVSSELSIETGIGTITSLTGYRRFDDVNVVDLDFRDSPSLNPIRDSRYNSETFTQELRLQNTAEGFLGAHSLEWLIGAFYSQEDLERRELITQRNTFGGAPLAIPLFDRERYQQSTDGWAVFAHGTLDVTDALSFTAGVRYNSESKDGSGTVVADPGFFLGDRENFVASREDEEITWTTSAQYRWTPDVMTYVTLSHGYKSGAINLDRGANPTAAPGDERLLIEPETADNVEVGIKSQWFNRRLTLNATVFHMQFEDFQVNFFEAGNFTLRNVSGASTRGVEVDGRFHVTDGLTLSSALTYTEARFDSDVAPVSSFVLAGQSLSYAPVWAGSIAADYEHGFGQNLIWSARAEMSFRSDYLTSNAVLLTPVPGTLFIGDAREGGYELFNARLAIGREDGGWEVALWGRNLGDQRYLETAFAFFGTNTFVPEPRTYGVALSTRF